MNRYIILLFDLFLLSIFLLTLLGHTGHIMPMQTNMHFRHAYLLILWLGGRVSRSARPFKGEMWGWRKALISLQNLCQPLIFIELIDND